MSKRRLFVVRHGRYNPNTRAGTGPQAELSEQGTRDAETISRILGSLGSDVRNAVLLTSMYRRTKQTAAAFADVVRAQPVEDMMWLGDGPGDLGDLANDLDQHGIRRHFVLVGHEPFIQGLWALSNQPGLRRSPVDFGTVYEFRFNSATGDLRYVTKHTQA